MADPIVVGGNQHVAFIGGFSPNAGIYIYNNQPDVNSDDVGVAAVTSAEVIDENSS